MKKILLAFAFLFAFSLASYSQTVVRGQGTATDGTVKKVEKSNYQLNWTYTVTNDTLRLLSNSVGADEYHIRINPGDTLKPCFFVSVKDTVKNSRTYKDDYFKLGDRLFIYATMGGGKDDTIKFDGNIQCDTIGKGNSTSLMVLVADSNLKEVVLEFVWNGSKFIESGMFSKRRAY